MKATPPLALLLSIAVAAPTSRSTPDYSRLTVAIVRAETASWPMPLMNKKWTDVQFTLNATIAKGIKLIEEAASNGANLVVFPELWFPGYPKGIADPRSIAPLLANYIDDFLTINSAHWRILIHTAATRNIYIAPAFSHLENGVLYMGQALISSNSTSFIRHKLRPSGKERDIWSDGTMDYMTFSMQSQAETLHPTAWPYTPDIADPRAAYWESLEMNLAVARVFAVNANPPLVFASVGNARFLDPQDLDLAIVEAETSTEEVPLVYQSFNTTDLAMTVPYTTHSEQSWSIL
ncbi:carbon-nitrogen hydrolase [Macroventuria anomochaeta]|uniref:Carbon-nitrogen hydrolase n=1 Tax=Macroventuria anomochaeta TaxID=301207 RepID=A0ACB6RJ15_9PLEO|nr:carbon-nitrogen hydrolase [Macroventuria anomochaeta]KAF2621871.1 carbon-nitrogen hydrolase [Macroventuria anomochaeta]